MHGSHFQAVLRTALAGALFVAIACSPQAQAPDPAAAAKAQEAERAVIDQLRSNYATAENGGDAAAVAALYTDDGVYMPSNMPAASGKAAIQSTYEQIFAQMSQQGSITPAGVDISGDWAIERGSYKSTVTPKAGGNPFEDAGKYVAVLKKTGSGWKVHFLIWNSDNPPPVAGK